MLSLILSKNFGYVKWIYGFDNFLKWNMPNTQTTQGNREMSKQETLDRFDLCQFVELCIYISGTPRYRCCWRIKQFTESTRYVIDTESPRS